MLTKMYVGVEDEVCLIAFSQEPHATTALTVTPLESYRSRASGIGASFVFRDSSAHSRSMRYGDPST
jgi:hypothetical protein